MLETEPRLIGSTTYHVRQLGSKEARNLLVRLTRIGAPILGAMMVEMGDVPQTTKASIQTALDTLENPPKEGEVTRSPEVTPLQDRLMDARKGKLEGIGTRALGRGLERLALSLKEEDLEYLCKVMGSVTQYESEPGKLLPLDLQRQELHFHGGRLAELFKWLAFGLEVQYRDFFPGAGPGEKPPGEERDSSS